MIDTTINVGDTVSVYFVSSNALFDYTVLYVPACSGESWILEGPGETIVYVQMFERMEKKP